MHPPIILTNSKLPRLHCKPEHPETFIFYSDCAHLQQLVSFRSLDIDRHLPLIHKWVNMEYTCRFWQMDGSYEPFEEVYEKILCHPNAHSFVGFYGDQLICQLDVYMVGADELSYQIPDESHHCGFHLLMGPNENPIKGLTIALLRGFLQYYFSFEQSAKMYAEPDIRNEKSIRLLDGLGFRFLEAISLSYKKAHLYCLDKTAFLKASAFKTSSSLTSPVRQKADTPSRGG